MSIMKPMLPTLTFDIPIGEEWSYEVKYDGFRAILVWDLSGISLISRNGKPLLKLFPEIETYLRLNEQVFKPIIPFIFDGELVQLENSYKGNFAALQVRGRMRSENKIMEKSKKAPCHYLVFDCLELKGKSINDMDYDARKDVLVEWFHNLQLPTVPDGENVTPIQLIPNYKNFSSLWEKVVLFNGEGIVAKQNQNKYEEGKRSSLWLKYKNWKYVSCFITSFDKDNGYFHVGVYKKKEIYPIGLFIFGLKPDEKQALRQILKENKKEENIQFIYVEPAICVELKYLEIYDGQLREPHFHRFLFERTPETCTFEIFLQQQKNLPSDVEITNPDKPLWENPLINKMDYIHFLREISPYLLPFLHDRLLTVIRYPHGMYGEPFYQKNRPDYTPSFIRTIPHENIEYIVCDNLKTLLWLGNQLAFEYHIPFQTIQSCVPSEIVFDLDPPSRDHFHLAIKAALLIKEVLDHLKLISFIKTSGNKGLQIYIPLPENTFSYEETRLFTSFVADYLVSTKPDYFTTERMKKNRGQRLYVDYIQHAAGKTIIAPYSPRGNPLATVAAPLFWEEINEKLKLENFTITNIVQRINKEGDPFQKYFYTKTIQNFEPVLSFLKNN